MAEYIRVEYNFNDRFILNDDSTDNDAFALIGIDSIADTLANNLEEDRPSDVGIVDYGVKLQKGQIQLPTTLYASDIGKMNKLIQDIKEAFNPDLLEADPTYGNDTDYGGYHPMKWTEDVNGVDKNFMIFLKSQEIPKMPGDSLAGLIRPTILKLKAEDPRKYEQLQATRSGEGVATNNGTVPTPAIITITASGTSSTSLQITNSTTGESIYITTALTAGQILVLNTRNHTARLAGADKRSYIGNTSEWFNFNPGANTLAITNGSNVVVSFAWYHAYSL